MYGVFSEFLCAWLCACVYAHARTCILARERAWLRPCVSGCVAGLGGCVCAHTCARASACARACECVRACASVRACVHAFVRACICVCVQVYAFVRVRVRCWVHGCSDARVGVGEVHRPARRRTSPGRPRVRQERQRLGSSARRRSPLRLQGELRSASALGLGRTILARGGESSVAGAPARTSSLVNLILVPRGRGRVAAPGLAQLLASCPAACRCRVRGPPPAYWQSCCRRK